MNMETLMQYAPKLVVFVIGAAFLYVVQRYMKANDVPSWLRRIYANMETATKNEAYRQSELADTNAELAKYPVPSPITPIENKQQMRLALYPKAMFLAGITGWVGVYLGLFETGSLGTGWPLYAGLVCIAATGVLYLLSEKERPYYRRVQQLNRKYLLEKAGTDAARCATLREVLEYYPALKPLWMELADQYAMEKRYDDAIAAIRKARELEPEDVDCLLIEASFQLRGGDEEAMAKTLNDAEKLRKIPSDPRIVIYRGALALRRNDKKLALRYGKEAMELDGDFTEKLVRKDEGLSELAALWETLFQKQEEKLLEEVAARREERKKGEN